MTSSDVSGLIITSALMIWKTLILITGSESPVSDYILTLATERVILASALMMPNIICKERPL